MKKSTAAESESPSRLIDARIRELDDWRGKTLAHVRALIKQLVAAESPAKPLSDSQLAELLEGQGIQVARRTVAKYREALKIAPANLRLEIGWTWIDPAFQRSAVNSEAKLLGMGHAFETLGIRRVEFKTDALNEQSRAAILGIGAQFEGIFRKHMVMPGGRARDSAYYSVIDTEWPDVRAYLQARLARHSLKEGSQ